ncbi:ferredoxin reductase family protein [Photobacterium nomapromontoriensis]|uniref:ferredoxin reductase family protein n=1 Tax=Photobacterium nomapromontoriensis TaxID=2910237 RepID=UPI003D11FA4B
MLRLTLLMVALWLPTVFMDSGEASGFIFWRHQLTMLTGFISLGYMCIAVLLIARFRWVEEWVNGLDKGYALHKQLGIGAVVALVAHWLVIKSAKLLIMLNLLSRPDRPRIAVEGINWPSLAEQVGEFAFYGLLIFSVISLAQVISYSKFKYTHKIGGVLLIASVFHAVFLLDWNLFSLTMNSAIIGLSVVGVGCSILSIVGVIGKENKVEGKVIAVEHFTDVTNESTVLRVSIQLESAIRYQEGQFAYLSFHDGEPPHPFSILNYDADNQVVEFGIKALGDYTNRLVNQVDVGLAVSVEGGYGRFQISNFKQQVWIGAGIGIVPFISRLYWLKYQAQSRHSLLENIHLFYCVSTQNQAHFSREIIRLLEGMDFITLHIVDTEHAERLNAEMVLQTIKHTDVDVSFCGPERFAQSLQCDLMRQGLPRQRFHRENFKMR